MTRGANISTVSYRGEKKKLINKKMSVCSGAIKEVLCIVLIEIPGLNLLPSCHFLPRFFTQVFIFIYDNTIFSDKVYERIFCYTCAVTRK